MTSVSPPLRQAAASMPAWRVLQFYFLQDIKDVDFSPTLQSWIFT